MAEAGIRFLDKVSRSGKGEFVSSSYERLFHNPINKLDPDLFWRLRPRANYKGMSINSLGFRGKEFLKEKDKNVIRIITMGDSCTLGVGVPDEKTYSSLLENILNKQVRSTKIYEVINAGVAGYSSLQGLRYFKNEIMSYKPDIITLYYGLNDYIYTSGPSDKDIVKINTWVVHVDNVLRKSRLYSFVSKKLKILMAASKFPPNRHVEESDFKRNLEKIIVTARKSGIKVLLIKLPLRPDIPLVINHIPILKGNKNRLLIEWLSPAVIGNINYFDKTEYEGSVSILEEAVEKYPQCALAHYFLAKSYRKRGQNDKAKIEFEKAREMDVDRQVVEKYNNVIEMISQDLKVPLVGLVGLFDKRKGEELFLDERHLNESGHKIVAEEIYRTLNENDLIVLN